MHYIYKLWNTKNKKLYIGQTKSPYYRFSRCQYRGKKIADAIKKIGWKNFHAEIIYQTDSKEKANEMELYYIKKFDTVNSGYNSTYNTHYVGNPKRDPSSAEKQRATMSTKKWFYNPKTGESFRLSPDESVPRDCVRGRGGWKPMGSFAISK